MTEQLGRRARWTAALLVAPGAAALFGASVDWAATAKPATSAKPVQQVLPAPTGPSARQVQAVQRLYRTALAHQRGAAAREKTLAALNRKLARMIAADNAFARAVAAAAASGDGPVGYTGTQAAQAPPPGPGPLPAAPVVVLPPPPVAAPAPPVQVVTGASGAPK